LSPKDGVTGNWTRVVRFGVVFSQNATLRELQSFEQSTMPKPMKFLTSMTQA